MTFADAIARANASVCKTFGVPAQLDYLPVVGIFERPHAQAFDGIATSSPRFKLQSADAEGVTLDSMLRIGDEQYQVRSVEPDGTGMTVLTLEAAL